MFGAPYNGSQLVIAKLWCGVKVFKSIPDIVCSSANFLAIVVIETFRYMFTDFDEIRCILNFLVSDW